MQEGLKLSEAKSLLKRSSSPVGRASFDATKAWKIVDLVEGLHSVRVLNLPAQKCRRLHDTSRVLHTRRPSLKLANAPPHAALCCGRSGFEWFG